MNRIGRAVLTGTEMLTIDEIEARIEAVTTEDVMALAAEHWQPDHMSAAAIGPRGDVIRTAIGTLATGLVAAG
jgi:predicted Zn-dependent peptidase